MVTALTILISIIGLAIIASCINRLIFVYTGAQDEIHYARTEDGYEVALYRYKPLHLTPGREPVIMCHGLGGNRYTWDPGPLPGFARYLKQHGFDTWLLDLRGRGLSSRPDRERGGRLKWGWTFDHYVKYDLPAAIKKVLRETGARQVNWVGHSMGGMVMYAYLQTQDASLVRSATAIGSPGTFKHVRMLSKPLLRSATGFLKRRNNFKIKPVGRAIAPLAYLFPAGRFGGSRSIFPWFAVIGAESPSTGVLLQFVDWTLNGTFRTVDHSYRYDEGFGKIKTPFMSVSSGGDFIAAPADVRFGVMNMAGEDKKYAFFSKKTGARENYDHMSILVSESAAIEVWPVMLDWLNEHSTK